MEQEFSRADGYGTGIERGEAACEFVRVEETRDGIELAEVGAGEGGFASAVGTCEEVEGWCGGWHLGRFPGGGLYRPFRAGDFWWKGTRGDAPGWDGLPLWGFGLGLWKGVGNALSHIIGKPRTLRR